MTLTEALSGQPITRLEALAELAKHGITTVETVQEFLDEVGDCKVYDSAEVLEWLGY